MLDSHLGQAKSQRKKVPRLNSQRRFIEAVLIVGALIPLVKEVCNYLGVPDRTGTLTAIVAAVIGALLLGLSWTFDLKEKLSGVLNNHAILGWTWVGAVLLALASIVYSAKTHETMLDPWAQWQATVAARADLCMIDDSRCLAAVLRDAADSEPGRAGRSPADELVTDLRAGQIVEHIQKFQSYLKSISIDSGPGSTFLGTGMSLPHGAKSYDGARLPEFLIPNYADTNKRVYVWSLETDNSQLEMPLRDALSNTAPIGAKRLNFSAFLKEISPHLSLDSPTPATIRFALITPFNYSGCLGPPGRHAVFASHLGMLLDARLSVEAAADMTGYKVLPKNNMKLFVFIFIPESANEAVLPTWENVFAGRATSEVTCQ